MVECIRYGMVVFLLLISSIKVLGQNDLENLFENRQYNEVIEALRKKDEVGELTFRDYFLLTRSYGRTQQYSNGLVYAKKMQDLALKANDTLELITAANLAAENFVDLGEIQEGLIYSKKILPFFREQDSIKYQQFCFKLGMLFYYNGDYEKAYETYNQIKKPEYRNRKLFYNNYALTLKGVRKWKEAIVYFKKGIEDSYATGGSATKTLSNIALCYLETENWEEAKVYLDSTENSFTPETSFTSKKKLYKHYFYYYNKQGKVTEASEILDFVYQLDRKIFKERLDEELQALETSEKNLETSEGNAKTLIKKVEFIDNKLVLSEKQKLWGAVVFLFITIGLLLFLFFYKFRNIKAAHENVVMEQRLLRAQMNPHFIFNSLSVLQGMILNKEDRKATKYVSKFSKLLRLILESSREKMVPINEELEAIKNYVDLQNMGRLVPFKYTLNIEEAIKDHQLLIPPMLIQPFVENAIEHGFKKDIDNAEITINLAFKDQKLYCQIQDNGIGLNANKEKSKTKKSLSTTITSERLKIISREYKVESNVTIEDRSLYNEQGTQVLLTLPYKIEEDA